MFSIVIPTYRRFESPAQTLDSIRRRHGVAIETPVVDQSPKPQALEIRRALDDAGLMASCRHLQTTPPPFDYDSVACGREHDVSAGRRIVGGRNRGRISPSFLYPKD